MNSAAATAAAVAYAAAPAVAAAPLLTPFPALPPFQRLYRTDAGFGGVEYISLLLDGPPRVLPPAGVVMRR